MGTTLAILLLACGWLPREIYLSENTADAVMDYIHASNPNADAWTVSCQMAEWLHCKVTEPEIPEPAIVDLADAIVERIGHQYIEQAQNHTVTIHCARINEGLDGYRWECQINRGGEWEELRVK